MNLFQAGLVFGQETEIVTVAVMDFRNINQNPELQYLAKGIPESILTLLGREGEVHIVERSQLDAALDEMRLGMSGIVDEQTAIEIGKAVQADAVISGGFMQVGNQIRIYARLFKVATSEVIAAEQIQGSSDEIFSLMDRTAAAMWGKLTGKAIDWKRIHAETMGKDKPSKPLYKRWWFWGILGAGVVGGVAYMATSGEKAEKEGTLAVTVYFP